MLEEYRGLFKAEAATSEASSQPATRVWPHIQPQHAVSRCRLLYSHTRVRDVAMPGAGCGGRSGRRSTIIVQSRRVFTGQPATLAPNPVATLAVSHESERSAQVANESALGFFPHFPGTDATAS